MATRQSLAMLAAGAGVAVSMLAAPGATAQDCTVKLGAVGPMSGGAAAWGLATKAAGDFVAALTNAEGGLKVGDKTCTVAIVSFDSQYTAAGGAAASNYLASEGVAVTLGPVGSPETTGFRPVAKRHGQVNISSSYMRDVISPDFPLAFHALQAPITFGPILIDAAKKQFDFKSVMITAPNDQGGTDGGKQLAALYEAAGVDATEEYYQRGTTNFAPLATRVMNANPDAVEVSGAPPGDATILVKQLLEAGYEGIIGSLGGIGSKPIIEGAGGIENLSAFYWLETSPLDHPGIVKMKEDFAATMGTEAPSTPTFPVYVIAAEQMLRAIADAGTDQDAEAVAAALRAMTPESRWMGKAGWRGKSIYGINQELTFPIGLGIAVDGVAHPVRTIEIPTE